MFGCLGKIINIVIIILAIVGFIALGGTNLIGDLIHNPFEPAQQSKTEKAAQIADFSKLNSEFELVSASKLPKVGTYVYIKHDASGQKFFFSKPTKPETLTKNDFSTKKSDEKILKFVKEFKIVQLENFEIVNRGSLKALNQTIPYIKFKSDIINIPMHGLEGIIGVATKDNKNIIVVAVNSNNKYSQIVTNALFNEIK
jgi:hypothetical protein